MKIARCILRFLNSSQRLLLHSPASSHGFENPHAPYFRIPQYCQLIWGKTEALQKKASSGGIAHSNAIKCRPCWSQISDCVAQQTTRWSCGCCCGRSTSYCFTIWVEEWISLLEGVCRSAFQMKNSPLRRKECFALFGEGGRACRCPAVLDHPHC